MRRFLSMFLAMVLVVFATPASAGRGKVIEILDEVEVATGTPVSVTKTIRDTTSGMLIIETENETAEASLVVTVHNVNPIEDTTICTVTAIEADLVYTAFVGANIGATDGIDQQCTKIPMGPAVKFTFTVSGVGADFDVTAYLVTTAN